MVLSVQMGVSKKKNRPFGGTYQIPGRKPSFKGERERQAGLDADGWSVSPNDSKSRREILVSPVPRQVINSLKQAREVLQGEGSEQLPPR